ncbi:MAG: hypothetical protein ACJ8C4_18250 [Gemmataceae bacterium]
MAVRYDCAIVFPILLGLATPALSTDVRPELVLAGCVEKQVAWTKEKIEAELAAEIKDITYRDKEQSVKARVIPLAKLIASAKPKVDPKRPHRIVSFCAIVRGSDGYTATFSLGELLPEYGAAEVYIALDRNGAPLPTKEQPLSLLVPHDQTRSRWVRGIAEIRVVDLSKGVYPAHWFAAIPKEGAPNWEILPQEAGSGEAILSKRNELGLLSNFAATPFTFHDKRYASLEGFWQMMKYPEAPDDERGRFPGIEWKHTRDEVARMVAFDAKKAGTLAEENMKAMKIDWVTFEGKKFAYRPKEPGEHYRLIVEATWEKVKQNPAVKGVLLSTGDLKLRPDHQHDSNSPAAWRYYDIMMEIRTKLQNEKQ